MSRPEENIRYPEQFPPDKSETFNWVENCPDLSDIYAYRARTAASAITDAYELPVCEFSQPAEVIRHEDGMIKTIRNQGFEFHRNEDGSTLLRRPDGREIRREGDRWFTEVDGTKIEVNEQAIIEYRKALIRTNRGCAPKVDKPHPCRDREEPVVNVYDDAASATDRENVVTRDRDGNTWVKTPFGRLLITEKNQIFAVEPDGTRRSLNPKEESWIRLTASGEIEINGVRVLDGKATICNGTQLSCGENGVTVMVPGGDGERGDVNVTTDLARGKEIWSREGARLSVTPEGQLTISDRQGQVQYIYDFVSRTMRGLYPGGEEWFSYDGNGNFRFRNRFIIGPNGEFRDEHGDSLNVDQHQQSADYANAVGNAQTIASIVNGKDARDIEPFDLSKLQEAKEILSKAIQLCIDRNDLIGLYHLYATQSAVQNAESRVQHVLNTRHEAYVAGLPEGLRHEAERRSDNGYAGNAREIVAKLDEDEEEQRRKFT